MSGHNFDILPDVPSKNEANASSQVDRMKYIRAWEQMMITIWREKIERLKVVDTTRLHQDISGTYNTNGDVSVIVHKFLEYGIYQDCGTGRGYSKGNGGYLDFMDEDIYNINNERKGIHLQKSGKKTKYGVHRKPREWFSRSYFASIMVLKEQMAYMYGEQFVGLVCDAISSTNRKESTSMRSYLWGHHGKRH